MILTKLKVENFKRFKDSTVFDLSIDNNNQNIVLIEALNGVGKTSFLQAIRAAFFGLEASEFKKYLSYQAREENDCSMLIEVEYTDNNFEPCRITRSYVAGNIDAIPKENRQLFINNILQSLSTEEWDEYLDKTFPREILDLFFFDGEKIAHLINPNDPKKIKSAIEKVLGIEPIRNLRDTLSGLKSDALKKIGQDGVNQKMSIYERQLGDYESRRQDIYQKREQVLSRIQESDGQKKEILDQIELLAKSGLTKEKLQEKEQKLSRLETLNQQLAEVKQQIEGFKNNQLDTFLLTGFFAGLQQAMERENQMKKVNSLALIDEEQADNLIKALFVPCCKVGGEVFDPAKKEELRMIIKGALAGESTTTAADIVLDLNKQEEININIAIDKIKSAASIDVSLLIDQKNTFLARIEILRREIQDIDRQTEGVENGQDTIGVLYGNLDAIGGLLQKLHTDLAILEKDLFNLDNEIRNVQRNMDILITQLSIVDQDKNYLDLLSRLSSFFETYISQLAEKKKVELEQKTLQMFQRLSNQDIYEKIEITDDYEVRLIDKNGAYQGNLSAGQSQILMTSLLWGLEQLSEFEIPVIIDTPLARLDPIHRKNMIEKYFHQAGGQVIILSQPSEITELDKSNPGFFQHLNKGMYMNIALNSTSMQSVVTQVFI